MSQIGTMEQEIVDTLKRDIPEIELHIRTQVITEAENEAAVEQQAAKEAEKCKTAGIFVYALPFSFAEFKGGLYQPFMRFALLVFSKNLKTHLELYEYMEKAIYSMYSKHFLIESCDPRPIKSKNTGLYRGVIIVSKRFIYPSTEI